MSLRIAPIAAAVITSLSLAAAGCGGGAMTGGGGATGSVSGAVVKGPVSGATVTAYAIDGGAMGAMLGSGATDASGHFSFATGEHAGAMMLVATGGAYVDEATTSTMPMHAGDRMTVALPAVAQGEEVTGVVMTPLTTMAQAFADGMMGGMTPDNVAAANAGVGSYFSCGDIAHTVPMDPTVSGSGAGASAEQRNYGMSIAAMSQYAKDLGMTASSGIVTAMMEDASDGIMDGMMGGMSISMMGMGGMMGGTMSPTAGTSDLATAMGAFADSPANMSGVTAADMAALMTKLASSSGTL